MDQECSSPEVVQIRAESIDRNLRAAFAKVEAEGVPHRFEALISQLRNSEGKS